MALEAQIGTGMVTASCSSEEALAHIAREGAPSFVIIDLALPGMNGAEAIYAIKQSAPNTSVIVMSGCDDRRSVEAALRAGAEVFVSKSVSKAVFADVVTSVVNKQAFVTKWIRGKPIPNMQENSLPNLTERQHECLMLLCQGLSNKEISYRMGVAEITIKLHIASIFRAFAVNNRTQAVLEARKLGYMSVRQSA